MISKRKGSESITIFPQVSFFLIVRRKASMLKSMLYPAKALKSFWVFSDFPAQPFHHDCYENFKHFVCKIIITLTLKKILLSLVFFFFFYTYLPSGWNLDHPIKWNLKYIKQLGASTWTIVAHIAPCHQDKNKTACLWLLPIQEMAFIETLKKQLWFTKNGSFVNVVINYNSLTSLNPTHAI